MSCVKASLLDKTQVLDKNRLVDYCPVAFGLEVLDTVNKGDIYAPSIWCRTALAILADSERKQHRVYTMESLKESDTLISHWELVGEILRSAESFHL